MGADYCQIHNLFVSFGAKLKEHYLKFFSFLCFSFIVILNLLDLICLNSKLGETMLLENILIIEGILETINNI